MKAIFAAEVYSSELVSEIEPLLRLHYDEIAWNKEKIALDPDYSRYRLLANSGRLRIFTARIADALVGYAVFLVQHHLHYRHNLLALNDIVYVEPGRRGALIGKQILVFAENELRAEGVQTIGLHIKKAHNWGPMAGYLGYEETESTWLKWIGD